MYALTIGILSLLLGIGLGYLWGYIDRDREINAEAERFANGVIAEYTRAVRACDPLDAVAIHVLEEIRNLPETER